MPELDRHHILFDRMSWNNRPEARSLRAYPMLIPKIYRRSHEDLHANTPVVPVLGYHALQRIIKGFECGSDTMSSIDNLLFAMEEANRHPKAHPLERSLSHIAMQAIELQRPFIQEGLSWRNKR